MGESDLDRHLAAGAGAPADPDDVGEPGSAAPEPGTGGPPDAPAGSATRAGSPARPVADRDLVEALADFVQDLVEGDESGGTEPPSGEELRGDGDPPTGEETAGTTGAC